MTTDFLKLAHLFETADGIITRNTSSSIVASTNGRVEMVQASVKGNVLTTFQKKTEELDPSCRSPLQYYTALSE